MASPTAAQGGSDSAKPSGSPSPTQGQPDTTIVAGASDVGAILFDATGQAIYIFDVETTTSPRCYDSCAEAWPPVLTQVAPQAGQGVKGMTGRTVLGQQTMKQRRPDILRPN